MFATPSWSPATGRPERAIMKTMGLSGPDAAHLVVSVALTYLLGFERDLRGAPTGDRVFALVGAATGVVGLIALHGAPNALAGAITGIGLIGAGPGFLAAMVS